MNINYSTRPRDRFGDDNPDWQTACNVDVRPADASTASSRSAGKVIAQRHPTGWFISAEYGPQSSLDHVDEFREFVAVRVYLLLKHGPQAGTWSAGNPRGTWLTTWRSGTGQLAEAVPDFVPVSWR